MDEVRKQGWEEEDEKGEELEGKVRMIMRRRSRGMEGKVRMIMRRRSRGYGREREDDHEEEVEGGGRVVGSGRGEEGWRGGRGGGAGHKRHEIDIGICKKKNRDFHVWALGQVNVRFETTCEEQNSMSDRFKMIPRLG